MAAFPQSQPPRELCRGEQAAAVTPGGSELQPWLWGASHSAAPHRSAAAQEDFWVPKNHFSPQEIGVIYAGFSAFKQHYCGLKQTSS